MGLVTDQHELQNHSIEMTDEKILCRNTPLQQSRKTHCSNVNMLSIIYTRASTGKDKIKLIFSLTPSLPPSLYSLLVSFSPCYEMRGKHDPQEQHNPVRKMENYSIENFHTSSWKTFYSSPQGSSSPIYVISVLLQDRN